MADDPGTLRARLAKLAKLVELARLSQSEDRARMEHTIRLVGWALQTVAWVRLRNGTAEHQREAAEIMVLCRRIVGEARAAELHIGDKDNHQ
jgi:hypothetical protein